MKKQILATMMVLGLTTSVFAKSLECTLTKGDENGTTSVQPFEEGPKGAAASLNLGFIDGRTYTASALSESASDIQKPSMIFISTINFSKPESTDALIVNGEGAAEMLSTYSLAPKIQGQVRVKCAVK
jgi:hypothetical protein